MRLDPASFARASFALSLGLALVLTLGWGDGEGVAGAYDRYAVASDHTVASRAGAEVLAAGGNAADAAAATLLTLGVVSPGSSGLGGGGFALYYKASDHSVTFLDFRERAPAAARPDMFENQQGGDGPASRPSQLGGLASGVPGEPAGIDELLRRFGGGVTREVVTAPAIRAAEEGFEVSSYLADLSSGFGAQMRRDPMLRTWFEGEATTLQSGATLHNAALAKTLRAFAAQGAAPFYRGAIAQEIVRANKRAGGRMTAADLASYRVVEREPLSLEVLGHRFVTAPPPSAGGYTLLASLAFLDRAIPPSRRRVGGAALLHAFAESFKGPFLDRSAYFGDPDHVRVPIAELLDADRVASRAALFHPTLATETEAYAFPLPEPEPAEAVTPEDHGTSHFCVVDAEGNVASVTTTVNLPFGARYTAAGMVMNDQMDDFASAVGVANAFSLPGGEPNLPGPGKRPVSTMSPTIVFRGDDPILCVGAAGGSRIVTSTLQVAYRNAVLGMPLEQAMAAPRIHHQGMPNTLVTETEAPIPAETLGLLRVRGHTLDTTAHIAVAQAIAISTEGGQRRLEAACDPRKGGTPAGD